MNAGVFLAKPFTQHTEADYNAALGIDVAGFFHMTRLAVAEMEKRSSSHIVQIITSLIDQVNSNVPSVLARLTKGGLNAAAKSLAIECAKRGIRVTAVSPGIVKHRCILPRCTRSWPPCTSSDAWARSRTSSARPCISNPHRSSLARSSTAAAGRARITEWLKNAPMRDQLR